MPEPRPKEIAAWVISEGNNANFIPLREVIEGVLATRLITYSAESRSELAEINEIEILKIMQEHSDQGKADGVVPYFEISSEEFTNYIKFYDRPELHLLDALRARTPGQFEDFCASILRALGGEAQVTGGLGDGGVDFYAFNLQFSPKGGPSPNGAKALVIGQAKRYAAGNNITLNDLRSFVGAATKKTFLFKQKFPTRIGIIHPIVLAFWTTSDFHREARVFANEMGLWYLNGIALAQLANRIGVGLD